MTNRVYNLALICLMCVILGVSTVKAYDEFCNAIIHGELTSDGQPLHMHVAYANETDPAIIPCWIKRLNSSQLPANHKHNPVLALLMTNYEAMEYFITMPQSAEGLYNITDFRYVSTSNTDYHIGFEYSIYMFDQSMDHTVAICGIRYYADATNKQCLATTFTLIRYNSSTVTTTEPPIITTAETTPTEYTTTEVTVSDPTTTTEGCNQTPDETNTPVTTIPVPPETATLGYSGPLVTGLSLSTSILVLMVVVLVLIIGILWVKLRTVSADIRVQRATCKCTHNLDKSEIRMNKEVVSDSGEENENSSSNPN